MISAVETLAFHAAASSKPERPQPPVSADLMALLEHFDCGVVIVDDDKDIVALNDGARCLLGDGLTITRNRLRATAPATQTALDGLIEAARRDGLISNMALPRPSGERPLVLRAQPLFKDRSIAGQAQRALVLLLIFCAEPHLAPSSGESLRALGVTRAEAEVGVLLGAGLSPLEVSERLDIKIATVRAHLKRIFQKLGLCRQSELVQLVTRLSFFR
ncbi:MAG: helix-turn-helix transcriptional regulator [Methylovirgula sp.]